MIKKLNLADKILLLLILLSLCFVLFKITKENLTSKSTVFASQNDGVTLSYDTMKLDINKANEKQLQSIMGIGEQTAKKIISLRETLGGFDSIDELILIDGIGEKKLLELRKYLTVEILGWEEKYYKWKIFLKIKICRFF